MSVSPIIRLLLLPVLCAAVPSLLHAKPEPTPATQAPSSASKTVAAIAETVRPSLVKVTQVGRGGAYGMGSDFVISADGLIATNRHVIGEARRINVETSDGRRHEVTEIVASDSKLDLAILRVASRDLPALELADSDTAVQGDPIVAMGNPEGLTYSVVEGVISEPRRIIEELPMIQVAVPIERGNSGGPLLDREGRVLGVLTLKSAITENLGFAMPVNVLKKLLRKPNPIPMERWLTIGVLNPRFWKTLLGSQWTQRAGIVHVTQSGDGFGGRSLCLWNERPAEDTFEAAVTVYLNDEAGAAGLAFCADGGDRHYGFYPTAGKLRLTRFDGPDVFSWKILNELESNAYKPSDWNTLRVRVEGPRILCYVNETLLIDTRDEGLRGGQAGLCKFRTTTASFKNFRTGLNLREKTLSTEASKEISQSLDAFLNGEFPREGAVSRFLQDPESSRRILTERSDRMERDAAMLRELTAELHRRSVRQRLAAELAKPDADTDLLHCTLLLSKHDNPELDIESYERGFAQMVQELRDQPEIRAGTRSAVQRINRYLFEENGFHGSRSEYSSRSNSYLNEVLDDREGLPITLSVLYVELARRLNVPGVAGIPLPGRFMVGYRETDGSEWRIIDVFDGGKEMTMEEAIEIVTDDGKVPEKSKQPAAKRDIVLRMIQNLLAPSMETRIPSKEGLPYLDLLLAINPDLHRERLSRAMLRETAGDRKGAATDVRWLLEHLPEGLRDEQIEMLGQWLERLGK